MNVAFLPVYPNPYQQLLREGLENAGITVEFLETLPTAEWLKTKRSRVDILHYHWLDGLYMNRFRTPVQALRFIHHYRLARDLGFHIVWTAHNILPHRSIIRPLDVAIHRLVMRDADVVITHCEAGRRELLDRFPRNGPIEVIPLGNYGGVYPVTMTKPEARGSLGLENSQFVYLALGNIAGYKGLEKFAAAFTQVAGKDDVAIVAGRNRDQSVVNRLKHLQAHDARIRVLDGYIPVDEMQRYLLAADVMVAPFEKVLTSSSVILGLTFGLPVIAPALGCLPELITDEAGILYRPSDPAALSQALVNIKSEDIAAMGATARRIADGLKWDDIGRRTASAYEKCLRS